MLGMSERTFRRWQGRYREDGVAGLADGRVGKPSPRRADEGELARARALYAEMYGGFTAKHFHEKLVERHGYRLGYTVTRLALQASGQLKRSTRRGAHRRMECAPRVGHGGRLIFPLLGLSEYESQCRDNTAATAPRSSARSSRSTTPVRRCMR
ncbi:MAG: helix-turn-helix domain-containing protein [Amaricoccus sp.]|nr:helix-turn-helix domain-containing protein [Amaricoccus sp.]